MPEYVNKPLHTYPHHHPNHPQHAQFPTPPVKCVKSAHKPDKPDISPYHHKKLQNNIKEVIFYFLYGLLVYPKILMYLVGIVSQKENPTRRTMKQTEHFLYEMAAHPISIIRC